MCSARWPGRHGDEHRVVGELLEQRLGVRPGRGLELADVDRERQPGLAAGQRQRLVEAGQLARRERAVSADVGPTRAVLELRVSDLDDLTTHRWHLPPPSSVTRPAAPARRRAARRRRGAGRTRTARSPTACPAGTGWAGAAIDLPYTANSDERDDAAGMPTNTSTRLQDSHGINSSEPAARARSRMGSRPAGAARGHAARSAGAGQPTAGPPRAARPAPAAAPRRRARPTSMMPIGSPSALWYSGSEIAG